MLKNANSSGAGGMTLEETLLGSCAVELLGLSLALGSIVFKATISRGGRHGITCVVELRVGGGVVVVVNG